MNKTEFEQKPLPINSEALQPTLPLSYEDTNMLYAGEWVAVRTTKSDKNKPIEGNVVISGLPREAAQTAARLRDGGFSAAMYRADPSNK